MKVAKVTQQNIDDFRLFLLTQYSNVFSILQACDKFLYCAEGVTNEHSCPPGLYFDEDTSNCDWKESVNRKCDQITKGQ